MILVLAVFLAKAGEFEHTPEHFTSVRLLGNYKVKLVEGEKEHIRVINTDEDFSEDRVIFEVKKEVLTVRIKGDTYMERDYLEIIITYTDLEAITAKTGCRVEVGSTLKGEKIELSSESGGKIKAQVDCDRLYADINAGGSIRIAGKCNSAEYKIGAGGTIAAVDTEVTKLKTTVTAGGEIICSVKDELVVKITSGGSVSYMGNPEAFEQNITLGGKVVKMKQPE